MNKILILALIVAAFVIGDPLTTATTAPTSNIEWDRDTLLAAGTLDTIKSSTDSMTFVSKLKLKNDWQYLLRIGTISGTGSDSVAFSLRADVYEMDTSTTSCMSVTFDSCTTANGEIMLIPYGSEFLGSKITIKGIGYTGAGGQAIVSNCSILKRRAFVNQRD